MAQKLTGMVNLSKIPKGLIFTTKKGDKGVFVNIINKKEEDKYGNTHTITIYDKDNRETIFLGDLKVEEYGKEGGSKPASKSAPQDDSDDLPFILRPR